jgi:thiamine biosynthesis lipoprotein
MKETRIMMGMPVTVEIVDPVAVQKEIDDAVRAVFDYFKYIDEKFSTYKTTSEITAINQKLLAPSEWSRDMKIIFTLAYETKRLTHGYFDIRMPNGKYDPSGIVKGWAIRNAAKIAEERGFKNFFVDAGGDIQTSGKNADGKKWAVGIKNPWDEKENVKVVYVSGEGVATSGTYIRGEHIYNPKDGKPANEIVSLTVVGPDIYEADRFATAAFAMGRAGIAFIEKRDGLEGYMIDKNRVATMTSGFEKYTQENI